MINDTGELSLGAVTVAEPWSISQWASAPSHQNGNGNGNGNGNKDKKDRNNGD
jgi:hypothetical protein